MKPILLILLALCLSIPALGNEATCNTITDPDRKHHCLALIKVQVSFCLAIKDNNLKSHLSASRFLRIKTLPIASHELDYCFADRIIGTQSACRTLLA